jgi:tetratricopeptide (TPR) repeat protein
MAKYPNERTARLLVDLGNILRAADQKDAALSALREALKIEPNDGPARAILIVVLSQTGRFDEAAQAAREALKSDPTNPDFNRLLGGALTQSGNNDEAIAFYKGLLEHYPSNEDIIRLAHAGLSVVYVNQGNFGQGESELEILFERAPDDAGFNNDLGYLYADQGKKLEQAEAMIRKAVEDEPENAAYLDSLGWVLFKRGKTKEAVEPLEKAVKRLEGSGGDATIYEHLGDVYFQLRETAKAKVAWTKAKEAAQKAIPIDKRLPEIQKKLESLEKLGAAPQPATGETP